MDYNKLVAMRNTGNPFAKHIGICVLKIDWEYAEAEIELHEEHLNPIGTVHGGCLYTLADVVAGAAVSAYGNYAATVSSSFYYLEPAKNVQKLYASATVSRQGKSLCVIDVVIWSEPGTIIAKGSLSYYILNKEIAMTD